MKAYDILEGLEVELNEVIKDDIMDDEDIDIDDDVIIDEDVIEGSVQELGDFISPKGPPQPHPTKYISRKFFYCQ